LRNNIEHKQNPIYNPTPLDEEVTAVTKLHLKIANKQGITHLPCKSRSSSTYENSSQIIQTLPHTLKKASDKKNVQLGRENVDTCMEDLAFCVKGEGERRAFGVPEVHLIGSSGFRTHTFGFLITAAAARRRPTAAGHTVAASRPCSRAVDCARSMLQKCNSRKLIPSSDKFPEVRDNWQRGTALQRPGSRSRAGDAVEIFSEGMEWVLTAHGRVRAHHMADIPRRRHNHVAAAAAALTCKFYRSRAWSYK
jgi:hypothetical protein